MTGQPSDPAPGSLTESQRTRADFARRDFDTIGAEDLVQLPREELILRVERLRGRLHDMLDLVEEVATPDLPA